MTIQEVFRVCVVVILSGCSVNKSNILFKADASMGTSWHERTDLVIFPGDELELLVVPWKGETLLINKVDEKPQPLSLKVNQAGITKIPMVGSINLTGMTLEKADSFLTIEFSKFMKEPFVTTRFLNKSVVVIGASESKPVLLPSQRIRLTEVIALNGGFLPESRYDNIRVLRGNEYFVANLQSAKNRVQNDIYILPGDVIYIEPIKRPFRDGFRDALPLISSLTSILSIAVILLSLL